MENNFDFITNTLVVGGGPSGSTVARKLAKNSIDVIIIEKNFSNDKPCGGGIKSIFYDEFDIPKEFENKRIEKFKFYSPKYVSNINLGSTQISIVLRKEFDENYRRLAQKDGATLIEGRYLETIYKDDYLIVKIKTKEKILTIKTKYLVAADGVTSSVRKDIAGSYPKAILTHYCNVPNSSIDYCEFHFGTSFAKNEYAWVFPHGEKVSVGTVLKETPDAKKEFLEFKNNVIENDTTKVNGFYIPLWQEDDLFYKNRVFFVGDAAGQVLPLTYEGIYYAMKSADVLADAIMEDNPESYEINWKKKYQKRFKFFKYMHKIFLFNDFMINKMVKFFQNNRFQKNALKYWEGSFKPLTFWQTTLKIGKNLLKI